MAGAAWSASGPAYIEAPRMRGGVRSAALDDLPMSVQNDDLVALLIAAAERARTISLTST